MPLGYIFAIVAATIVVSTAAANTFETNAPTLAVQYFFTLSAIGAAAFLPAAGAIIAAEMFRLRSVFYFLAVGGGLGIVLNQMSIGNEFTSAVLDRENLVFPAAGFAGGFVYWLVAGRMSGHFGLAATHDTSSDRQGAAQRTVPPADHPPMTGEASGDTRDTRSDR